MLAYKFMQRALIVSLMISIMIPLIGIVMVNRKTSMIGDALSHVSLAGIGLGLIFAFDPLIGAIFACIVGAFSIEGIRKKFPQYGDMATAIIVSIGLGLAAILSDLAPGGNTFESYLFGSIASVSPVDVIIVSITFILVVGASIIFYSGLLDIAVDSNLARMAGVKVSTVNNIFTFLSALTIALSAKIIGALMITSLIVLPVATALLVSRSYKQTWILSIALGIIYMMVGVVFSYYYDIKPGGAIVINAVVGMLIFWIISRLRKVQTKNPIEQVEI